MPMATMTSCRGAAPGTHRVDLGIRSARDVCLWVMRDGTG